MGVLDGNIITKDTAYLMGFRTNEINQNKGYFSKLYKFLEKDLKNRGFKYLTLGVEPCEVRNMQIYFNWGFNQFVKSDYEYYANGEKYLLIIIEKNCDGGFLCLII